MRFHEKSTAAFHDGELAWKSVRCESIRKASSSLGGCPPGWERRTIPPSSVGEPSLLGRRTLPPRSANPPSSVGEAVPPSSVGEPSLLGRRSSSSLLGRELTSSVGEAVPPPGRVRPRIRRHVFSGRWSVLGRPSDGLRFAGGGGGADRWSRGNAQERRRTRKMQKIICENIDKIR